MNDLQVFTDPEFGHVRTLTVDDDPWFVGKDVCVALGYSNHNDALTRHVDAEDKRGSEITTPGGQQYITLINEAGLYSLIFGSKLPSAKRFKRWVTAEVLPTIRKTGSFGSAKSSNDYLTAARIMATCKNDRLPYVLDLLKLAGFVLPKLKVHGTSDLRLLMDQNNVSLRELERRTGFPKSSLSYYIRGIYKPTQSRYEAIVAAITEDYPTR